MTRPDVDSGAVKIQILVIIHSTNTTQQTGTSLLHPTRLNGFISSSLQNNIMTVGGKSQTE